jgi:hypothetical protein
MRMARLTLPSVLRYTPLLPAAPTSSTTTEPTRPAAASADVIIRAKQQSFRLFSRIAGDFNADGKTDIVVGSRPSDTGRAYIFYNDGAYPTTAATADVTSFRAKAE